MHPIEITEEDFDLTAYDYPLPPDHIAQHPAARRDQSKLMIMEGEKNDPIHAHFSDIVNYFKAGDIMVVNDTKVFPARLHGHKETGGKAEVFLLGLPSPVDKTVYTPQEGKTCFATQALVKSSKRPHPGSRIHISDRLSCLVNKDLQEGKAEIILEFDATLSLDEILGREGQVPLPPYIERQGGTTNEDRERYQTVYASHPGAVAAPTAGLHFTPEILQELQARGVLMASVTLHVGYGTFAPVRSEHITDHQIHSEFVSIDREMAEKINRVKKEGGRVWAVGTTSVRALEFASNAEGEVQPCQGWCQLYITPGYRFKVIDNLITNFHLPQSSLLFLVSALCGRKKLLRFYEEAIEKDYRFFSYGDAMAIIRK